MYTFKITFQLFNGGRKYYTVKAGSPDAAIEKARNKARRDCLEQPVKSLSIVWDRLCRRRS